MIEFYCGVGERRWNYHPVAPGPLACISPVKGRTKRTLRENRVTVPDEVTGIIQDSGAFQDAMDNRLTFAAALDRQVAHADKYHYANRIVYRVSYDLLIDEVWQNGNRYKRRWSVQDAETAVAETIAAAAYLAQHRNGYNLILSAQGVDAAQYTRCVEAILPYLDTARDTLGLGGWCIIGMMPRRMMPVFRETLHAVIPMVARAGIQRVHIFGVIFPAALGELLWMADRHGIAVSTDSTSPANNPWRGDWGYGEWRDNSYQVVPTSIRGLERARHVQLTRAWLARLRETPWYREPVYHPRQMVLF